MQERRKKKNAPIINQIEWNVHEQNIKIFLGNFFFFFFPYMTQRYIADTRQNGTQIGTLHSTPLHHDFLFVGIHTHLRPSPLRWRS